jgi:hypothetical protein
MNTILANAYVPFAFIAPAAQVGLLVLIIIFESWFIARMNHVTVTRQFIWRITLANLLTAVLGVGVLLLATWFEMTILWKWGSEHHINPTLWWFSVYIYGFFLPLSVWLACYHVSWRVEYWVLSKWEAILGMQVSKKSIIAAHRWSYALLLLIVLSGVTPYLIDIMDRF